MKTTTLLDDGDSVRLDERHKLFVEEYVANGGDRLAAAKKAQVGNSKNLIERPQIQKYIKYLSSKIAQREEAIDRVSLSADTVLRDLQVAKRLALEIFYDAQGNKRREIKTFLKAVELEGNFLALWNNKPVLEQPKTNRPLKDLPAEALEEMEKLLDQYNPTQQAEVLAIEDVKDDKQVSDDEF